MNTIEIASINRELQKRLFDADYNLRYHEKLVRWYTNLDLAIRLILSFSGIVVFVCAGLFVMPDHPKMWSTIAGAITLISTSFLPLLKWNKLISRIESEKLTWVQLKNEYENLWKDTCASYDWETAKLDLKKLRKRDIAAEKSGGTIPLSKKLQSDAENEVKAFYKQL